MKTNKIIEFQKNISKMRYLQDMMKDTVPYAIPIGVFEKIISSLTDFFNGTILIKLILDQITAGSNIDSLKNLFIIAVSINVFRLLVFVIYTISIGPMDIIMEAKLKEKAYNHAGKLKFSNQYDQQAKDTIYWSCGSIKGIVVLFYLAIVKYSGLLVSYIVSFALCIFYGHVGGGIVAALICIVEIRMQKKQIYINEVRFSEAQARNVLARKKEYYKQNIFLNKENNQSIRVNNNFSFFRKKYLEYSREDVKTTVEHEKSIWKQETVRELISRVALYGVEMMFLLYELLVIKEITVGAFIALISAFAMVKASCPISICSEFQNLGQYVDVLKSFFEGLETEKGGTLHVNRDDFVIEFKNVSYTYPGGEEKVIKNLNFKLAKGDMTVLLGENGAGKSTILLLLYRLVEPQEGEITLNGISISEYDLLEYRAMFGTMFQDDNIFPLTIGDNVALELMHEERKKDIIDALSKAGFNNKIVRNEKGIDISLTKRFDSDGFVPSGGEARKIVFARNMYSDAPIKFFDEYDSNIDPLSEVRLNNAMADVEGTKLIITHRLPIAKKATNIVIMKDGAIFETGTHEELINKKGLYYELMRTGRTIYAE